MKEFLFKLLVAAVAALAPIHAVIITVGVLIFADLVTGIWAARKRKEKITSKRLRESVTKMCIYQTVIVTGFLVETHLLEGLVPVVKLAGLVIGLVELKSLFENANSILGKNIFKEPVSRLESEASETKKES